MPYSPYYVNRKHPAVFVSALFMVFAVILRTVYFMKTPISGLQWVIHYGLPVLAAVWFVAVVYFLGREVWLTCGSVFAGVVFFICKAFTFETMIHMFLCVILYLVVLCVYMLTIFGILPTKKVLYPLFGLPLAYHILVEDTKLYIFADPPVPFLHWLPEISVLCIMASLLTIAFALKEKVAVEKKIYKQERKSIEKTDTRK